MFESIPWYWDITMIIGYLVLGYGWTMGFRFYLLDNGKWDDGEFTIQHALIMTLLWPFMVMFGGAYVFYVGVPNFLRKIYRLENKCNKA